MARKRMVSPELLTSRTIASLPIPTRYAFVALWMYCDDEGRGIDDLYLIKAHSWPLDRAYSLRKVASDLSKLAEAGAICRYEASGAAYFHCPAWTLWQKVQHPTASRIMPCPGETYSKGHEAYVNQTRAAHERLTAIEVSSVQERLSSSGEVVDRANRVRSLAGFPLREESA